MTDGEGGFSQLVAILREESLLSVLLRALGEIDEIRPYKAAHYVIYIIRYPVSSVYLNSPLSIRDPETAM